MSPWLADTIMHGQGGAAAAAHRPAAAGPSEKQIKCMTKRAYYKRRRKVSRLIKMGAVDLIRFVPYDSVLTPFLAIVSSLEPTRRGWRPNTCWTASSRAWTQPSRYDNDRYGIVIDADMV